MLALKINNVSKRYDKNQDYIIKNISFSVEEGEIFGMLGQNGAGKTTLLKSICNIHDFEGSVVINNYDVKKENVNAMLNLAFIPDNHATFEQLTGYEYINFLADMYKVENDIRNKRIKEMSEVFDMEKHLNRPIKFYSHGMKQKIAIMGGIIHYPKVWILDEPLVGIDPGSLIKIKEFMKKYTKEGRSIIFSSHIISIIKELCQRALILENKTSRIIDIKKYSQKEIEDIFANV